MAKKDSLKKLIYLLNFLRVFSDYQKKLVKKAKIRIRKTENRKQKTENS